MVWARWRWAEPELPVERRRDVVHLGRTRHSLWPDRPVGPELDRVDLADRARLDPLADLARPLVRVSLITHLRRLLWPPRCLRGELARLPDRPRERLLRVDVLACLEGRHRRHRVRVVGGGDRDGVDITSFLIEHFPIVLVTLGLRECVEAVRGILLIDVAQSVDVLVRAHAADVVRAHPADADAGDVELVAWWNMTLPEHVGGNDSERSRGRGDLADEGTAGYRIVVRHRVSERRMRGEYSGGAPDATSRGWRNGRHRSIFGSWRISREWPSCRSAGRCRTRSRGRSRHVDSLRQLAPGPSRLSDRRLGFHHCSPDHEFTSRSSRLLRPRQHVIARALPSDGPAGQGHLL